MAVDADAARALTELGTVDGDRDACSDCCRQHRRRFAMRAARLRRYRALSVSAALSLTVAVVGAPTAAADNTRLNNGVVKNVFTVQRQAGCVTTIKSDPQLTLAAQWHADDVLNNRDLNGDMGSNGSTPQDRAAAAGYHGRAVETVAINPALAISGIELINQWYYDPASLAIMQDCNNSAIGVWSVHSMDRTVVVAVYGDPAP